MRIHLIHGIHTEPTSPVVPGLIPFLKRTGLPVFAPNYNFILAAETRRVNPMVANVLLPYIEAGDILVGHSNGCAIAHALLVLGAPASGLICINAALDNDIEIPKQLKWMTVYWNEDDTLVEVAQLASVVGIAPRAWGMMGHTGYTGPSLLPKSISCGKDRPVGMPWVRGHSDFFTHANLPAWGDDVRSRIMGNVCS